MSIRSTFCVCLVLMPILLLTVACSRREGQATSTPSRPSEIKVTVNDGGPLVLQTSTAEFHVLPSGYVQGFLLKDGKKLTLDEPSSDAHSSDYVIAAGKDIQFKIDFGQAKVRESEGKMGRGKHVEIQAQPLDSASGSGIQQTLTVEAYDDFPNIVLASMEYRNAGQSDFKIDQAVAQSRRLNAALSEHQATHGMAKIQ